MNTRPQHQRQTSLKSRTSLLVVAFTLGGCASAPTALNEEELLTLLAAATREGPYQLQRQTWPQLEKKTIRYCGPIAESKVVGTGAMLLLKVDKPHTGKKLPWSLEGRSDSSSLAQSHKTGEPVCMTGVIESFMERDNVYWGYVKIASVEKSPTS